ncbi:hypothetical protein SNOG_06100 [Parastagonospora nodorum SN15]|uniref:Uncharacterized protein n=1 Tax=Phaeosphaeria nodorum (strain SN15 / ATCC MYA-4574 / FGSC 10173) TaxID=321614 RepID=Q0UQ64_PHANO|nr:hypothetical protein SNOG_06100 [Parastagonospora nodorum SN15]EAT85931.1 hypothetical protein SNOG_06100 [Parastagonospora nodorum SN15]
MCGISRIIYQQKFDDVNVASIGRSSYGVQEQRSTEGNPSARSLMTRLSSPNQAAALRRWRLKSIADSSTSASFTSKDATAGQYIVIAGRRSITIL